MSVKSRVLMTVGVSVLAFGAMMSVSSGQNAAPSSPPALTPAQISAFETNPQGFINDAKKQGQTISAVISQLVTSDPGDSTLLSAITSFASNADAGTQAAIGAGLGQAAAALTKSGDTTDAKAIATAVGAAALAGDTAMNTSFTTASGGTQTASTGPGTAPGATGGATGGGTGGATGGGNGGSVGGLGTQGGSGGGSGGGTGSTGGGTSNSGSTTTLAQGGGVSVP